MEQAAARAAGGQTASDDGYIAMLAERDRRALTVLQEAWGEQYEIGVYDMGGWWWRRRGDLVEKAGSPDQVQAAIAADHASRPAPQPERSR